MKPTKLPPPQKKAVKGNVDHLPRRKHNSGQTSFFFSRYKTSQTELRFSLLLVFLSFVFIYLFIYLFFWGGGLLFVSRTKWLKVFERAVVVRHYNAQLAIYPLKNLKPSDYIVADELLNRVWVLTVETFHCLWTSYLAGWWTLTNPDSPPWSLIVFPFREWRQIWVIVFDWLESEETRHGSLEVEYSTIIFYISYKCFLKCGGTINDLTLDLIRVRQWRTVQHETDLRLGYVCRPASGHPIILLFSHKTRVISQSQTKNPAEIPRKAKHIYLEKRNFSCWGAKDSLIIYLIVHYNNTKSFIYGLYTDRREKKD